MIKVLEHSKELVLELSEYALNKDVYKELGYPLYSDDKHLWFLYYNKNKLIAFCSIVYTKKGMKYHHDYVSKENRNKGIYKKLFKERLKHSIGYVESVCTKNSIKTFLKNGFSIEKETKNYTFVSKTI